MKGLVDQVRQALRESEGLSKEQFERIVGEVFSRDEAKTCEVLPEDWEERFIPFVRQEGLKITTVAMLRVHSRLKDSEEIVEAIKAAVTKWVGTTEKGANLWRGTCEDLNVGDLGSGEYFQDEDLRRLLKHEGVVIAEGLVGDGEGEWSYDTVLVDGSDAGVMATTEEE